MATMVACTEVVTNGTFILTRSALAACLQKCVVAIHDHNDSNHGFDYRGCSFAASSFVLTWYDACAMSNTAGTVKDEERFCRNLPAGIKLVDYIVMLLPTSSLVKKIIRISMSLMKTRVSCSDCTA